MQPSPESDSQAMFAVVYEELRKLAAARLKKELPGQTLQPTALVHEVYLRLVGTGAAQKWDSVGHFFAAAAESMRRILIDQARRRKRRIGLREEEPFCVQLTGLNNQLNEEQLLSLDCALRAFEQVDPVKARLVVIRYFGGLSIEQACELMNLSRTTASRYLTYARAWLFRHMSSAG